MALGIPPLLKWTYPSADAHLRFQHVQRRARLPHMLLPYLSCPGRDGFGFRYACQIKGILFEPASTAGYGFLRTRGSGGDYNSKQCRQGYRSVGPPDGFYLLSEFLKCNGRRLPRRWRLGQQCTSLRPQIDSNQLLTRYTPRFGYTKSAHPDRRRAKPCTPTKGLYWTYVGMEETGPNFSQ